MSDTARMNARILVIDDDEAVRDSFRTVLRAGSKSDPAVRAAASVLFDEPDDTETRSETLTERRSVAPIAFELDVAESGERGIELAREAVALARPYAVIFCDMRMPGIDGVETIERIRAFEPRAEVVFVTAYSDHSVADIVERAGPDVGYFVKPFASDEMRQLSTKLVIEWNKAREIETLVRAIALLRGDHGDVHRVVEHLLREVCLWLDTSSAALLRKTEDAGFVIELGVGSLGDRSAARAVVDRLNGDLLARATDAGSSQITRLPDGTTILPLRQFGVAIALRTAARITPDRRYLLEVFLENAALALRNNEISARLRESERLAATGRALGFILHDVRNPLNSARLITHLLRDGALNSQETLESLNRLDFELTRAIELIGDTLSVCRGRLDVRPQTLSASSALRDRSAPWRVRLAQRGVFVDDSRAADVYVFADPVSLGRALYNLSSNAADAVVGDGEMGIEVGARPLDGGVEIWVSDEGPGVPDTLLSTLFRPLATEGKSDGTGFGLAIVRQIVAAHGGRVTYARVEGKSRFTMWFPDPPDL